MIVNTRIHYLSILKVPSHKDTQSLKTAENIRIGIRNWILFREYWNPHDNLDEFAKKLGATKDEISSYLRTHLGKKYFAMRKELRIADAQELVTSCPGTAVYEIARTVGITDKSNFRKEFTEIVGVSPTIWRECGGNRFKCRVIRLEETMRNHCRTIHRLLSRC